MAQGMGQKKRTAEPKNNEPQPATSRSILSSQPKGSGRVECRISNARLPCIVCWVRIIIELWTKCSNMHHNNFKALRAGRMSKDGIAALCPFYNKTQDGWFDPDTQLWRSFLATFTVLVLVTNNESVIRIKYEQQNRLISLQDHRLCPRSLQSFFGSF